MKDFIEAKRSKWKQQCPNCKSKNTYAMAYEEMYGYYHCNNCNHDFIVNMSEVLQEKELFEDNRF